MGAGSTRRGGGRHAGGSPGGGGGRAAAAAGGRRRSVARRGGARGLAWGGGGTSYIQKAEAAREGRRKEIVCLRVGSGLRPGEARARWCGRTRSVGRRGVRVRGKEDE